MIRLSVCIPTYNRGQFIGETIDSIIAQSTDDIEIVVSDNGSSDNTKELIHAYQEKFPRIQYFRWDSNVGADRNFLKVIELATGDYCWFMGSDDRTEPGSIQHILMQLKSHPGIAGASVNQAFYTPELWVERKGVSVAGGRLESDRLFKNAEECFSLLGLYFGYLPGQIVNRELWSRTVSATDPEPYFNAFVHVYVIGRMLRVNPNWLYIHRRCVGYRSGNDSFLQEVGVYKREVIAHACFEEIVRNLFGKRSAPYNAVLELALTGYMRGGLANFKKNGASLGLQARLLILYSRFYWHFPYYWLNVLPLFFVPNKLVSILERIYKYRQRRGV